MLGPPELWEINTYCLGQSSGPGSFFEGYFLMIDSISLISIIVFRSSILDSVLVTATLETAGRDFCWFFLIVVHLLVWFVISDCKLIFRFSSLVGVLSIGNISIGSFINSRSALYFQFGIFHIMWIGCSKVLGSQEWLSHLWSKGDSQILCCCLNPASGNICNPHSTIVFKTYARHSGSSPCFIQAYSFISLCTNVSICALKVEINLCVILWLRKQIRYFI